MKKILSGIAFILFCPPLAFAQTGNKNTAPQGATGSTDVFVEGKQAKRAGDMNPEDVIHSPNVFINGKPAIIGCKKGTPITSASVFINGKPKVLGCKL